VERRARTSSRQYDITGAPKGITQHESAAISHPGTMQSPMPRHFARNICVSDERAEAEVRQRWSILTTRKPVPNVADRMDDLNMQSL
jgi:hypothetical protein